MYIFGDIDLIFQILVFKHFLPGDLSFESNFLNQQFPFKTSVDIADCSCLQAEIFLYFFYNNQRSLCSDADDKVAEFGRRGIRDRCGDCKTICNH